MNMNTLEKKKSTMETVIIIQMEMVPETNLLLEWIRMAVKDDECMLIKR